LTAPHHPRPPSFSCRIEILKIAEDLNRDHAPGNRVIIFDAGFQIGGQSFQAHSEKPELPLITVVPDHFQVFKMILDTLEVMGLARVARFVDVKGFSGGNGF